MAGTSSLLIWLSRNNRLIYTLLYPSLIPFILGTTLLYIDSFLYSLYLQSLVKKPLFMIIYKLDLVSISHYLVLTFYITAIAINNKFKDTIDEFLFITVDLLRFSSTIYYISLFRQSLSRSILILSFILSNGTMLLVN